MADAEAGEEYPAAGRRTEERGRHGSPRARTETTQRGECSPRPPLRGWMTAMTRRPRHNAPARRRVGCEGDRPDGGGLGARGPGRMAEPDAAAGCWRTRTAQARRGCAGGGEEPFVEAREDMVQPKWRGPEWGRVLGLLGGGPDSRARLGTVVKQSTAAWRRLCARHWRGSSDGEAVTVWLTYGHYLGVVQGISDLYTCDIRPWFD